CIGVRSGPTPVALPCEPGKATVVVSPAGGGATHLLNLISTRARLVGRAASVRIIDDLHLLEHADLDECAEALKAGKHLVVAITPEGLSQGFHPLFSRLRHAEHVLYLTLMPRSLTGVDL